jgi:GntR family transcriptional regulator, transcriptional repressor for pyruvate dehydrogenase complex
VILRRPVRARWRNVSTGIASLGRVPCPCEPRGIRGRADFPPYVLELFSRSSMTDRIGERELQLEAVEQPRAHEYVAEQLRREMALRVLDPTEPLPAERDLARIFRVSRATVQRAMTLLEAEGLIQRRRGRNGGTFVVGQVTEASSNVLVDSIRRNRDLIEETLAFRAEIEPAAAALAARGASKDELDAIERAAQLSAAASDDAEFMRHDTSMHIAVARASHNRYFIEAVERIRIVLNDVLPALPESRMWHERTHRQHAMLLTALRARDPKAARRAMTTHIADSAASVHALLETLGHA